MNSRAHCCSQISTFTQKSDTILIDCCIWSLLSQHQKGIQWKGANSSRITIRSRNQMFKWYSIFKHLFGKPCVLGVRFVSCLSPTPLRSSATVPPSVPVAVPSLGLSSLSFCKTKKVRPMLCVWAAQQMRWSRVSWSHFFCTFCWT